MSTPRTDPSADAAPATGEDEYRHRAAALFAVALFVVCGLCAYAGIPPLRIFEHDVFFFLDSAYRVARGQVPYRDFSTAWGPVIYLIDAAGLQLSAMRPEGLAYANALFGALIAVWTFLIARPRWSSPAACALGIYTVLLITAPFPLGYDSERFCPAMSYNRYGYALFGIILLECAAYMLAESGIRHSFRGALSTGAAIALLCFLKISFGVIALGFVAACTLIGPSGRLRRGALLGCGFAAVAAVLLCYLRFDVHDMLQDLAMAARSRRLNLLLARVTETHNILYNVPLLLLAAWACAGKPGGFGNNRVRIRGMLMAVLTLATGAALLITNQQPGIFPLNGYLATVLLVIATGLPQASATPRQNLVTTAPLLLLWGLCFLPLTMQDAVSLTLAAAERWHPEKADGPSLAAPGRGGDLVFAHMTTPQQSSGAEYVNALNDGLALLRRTPGNGGVLTFDMFNPFNYILDRPPPAGGFAAAAYNYFFSDTAYLPAKRFFGTASYIMVRKYKKSAEGVGEEDGDVKGLLKIYGAPLRAHFTIAGESEYWVLWRRRPDAASIP